MILSFPREKRFIVLIEQWNNRHWIVEGNKMSKSLGNVVSPRGQVAGAICYCGSILCIVMLVSIFVSYLDYIC